jgi:hypothetical protein
VSARMSTQVWKDAHIAEMRAYHRKNYQSHKQEAIVRATKRRKRIIAWFTSLKTGKCCKRCPETHPACLEFHHRDGNSKVLEIAAMVSQGWSERKIVDEIEKCDLICANCHRKHHWVEREARVAQMD